MIEKVDYVPATVRTEPVQQRSAERITSLLDTAAELIDEKGIDGLTTSDVALRSGSSVGVVYRYFPNIQSLLRALAARNMDKFTDRIHMTMSESRDEWLTALDATIDAYVDLVRTEPGFRAVRFGDIIDERFVQPEVTNNTLLANKFHEVLTTGCGLPASDELFFDLEVVVGIADSLLHRAFIYDKQGEDKFIDRTRTIVRDIMGPHRLAS